MTVLDVFTAVDRWAPLAVLLLQPVLIGVAWLAWWALRKTFVQITEFEKRCGKLDRRIDGLETRVAVLPSAAAVQEILLGQLKIQGDIQGLSEKLTGVANNTALLMRVHTGDRNG